MSDHMLSVFRHIFQICNICSLIINLGVCTGATHFPGTENRFEEINLRVVVTTYEV